MVVSVQGEHLSPRNFGQTDSVGFIVVLPFGALVDLQLRCLLVDLVGSDRVIVQRHEGLVLQHQASECSA